MKCSSNGGPGHLNLPPKRGKFLYRDVLLEVSYLRDKIPLMQLAGLPTRARRACPIHINRRGKGREETTGGDQPSRPEERRPPARAGGLRPAWPWLPPPNRPRPALAQEPSPAHGRGQGEGRPSPAAATASPRRRAAPGVAAASAARQPGPRLTAPGAWGRLG